MKLKPFNEAEALAGKPVITRDGRKVEQLVKFNVTKSNYPFRGVIDGEIIEQWSEKGEIYRDNTPTPSDLFMAPEVVTMWVNVYRESRYRQTSNIYVAGQKIFNTKEEAISNSVDGVIDTVPVTFTI